MFYNLHQHREATCRRQKEAWKETINERLSKCEEDIRSIPIVIWGLEASPSYFDSSPSYKNRIETTPGVSSRQYLLHKNYLYNDLEKGGNNYGVRIIKNWINKNDKAIVKKKGSPKKTSVFSYESLITQLSKGNFFYEEIHENEETHEVMVADGAIHLVYDIFPEWHGLPVSRVNRDSCYNESYMCSKVDDFKQHVEHIKDVFRECNDKVVPGDIHFVWLGTKQANKHYPGKKACTTFFCCLKKKLHSITFWYNPGGFVTKKKKLKKWAIDCP